MKVKVDGGTIYETYVIRRQAGSAQGEHCLHCFKRMTEAQKLYTYGDGWREVFCSVKCRNRYYAKLRRRYKFHPAEGVVFVD